MRPIPILTAIVVMLSLYLLVFERNGVMAVAQRETAEATVDAPVEEEPHAVRVVAIASRARDVDSSVLIRGRTEAARQVDVRAETSGSVISSPLSKGASVEAGDLLCMLDPGTRDTALAEAEARAPEAEARLSEAEARLVEAEINNRAAAQLSEGGFASETRVASAQAAVQSARAGVEAARAGVQSAQAAVAAAQKEIERLEIRAPFPGLLETDAAEQGSLLQPGALCATIVQLDPITLVGFVPETDIDRVEPGAPAAARLASGRQVVGEVVFVSRSADETTRTFRVDVQVENGDLSIRDGQTAEMMIEAEGETAHLLPQSALTLDDEGRLGIRTVAAGRAEFLPVSVLRDTMEGIWVTGLGPEVDVIVVGQEFVTDGVPVEPTYRESAG
ncbi:efflux RND transporter periplasmic adaptor subunit [Roseitranquillus sediminis]|uniref:efflux RND transporter periplasmic adaptor subunit n=1 Tax=Roseitranquillus sediminis TaxID=2809051 RepID=UPI001D0CC734|nr:efflux RND transporter periplasmic adaptor subunit [Roseitranquillus sediminis]MBM9594355.1 efflux RND transporter periplasmic adaptor subunit [Roseitranquillus sediminis]